MPSVIHYMVSSSCGRRFICDAASAASGRDSKIFFLDRWAFVLQCPDDNVNAVQYLSERVEL
jgi:hypothetical protein